MKKMNVKKISQNAVRIFVTCVFVIGMMPSFAFADDAAPSSASEITANEGNDTSQSDANNTSNEASSTSQSTTQEIANETTTRAEQDQAEPQELTAQVELGINADRGTCGTCSWTVDTDGNMIVWPTDGNSGTLDATTNYPWFMRSGVTTIKFNPGVHIVGSANSLFYACTDLTSIDLSNLDTSQITDMAYMFYGCSSLASLNLSHFNTSNVTDMNAMFDDCMSLTSLDLSSFDTSHVTNMSNMFYNCSGLTALDVSSFNTSQVTNMESMFGRCSSLTTLDLDNFDTSKVTGMGWLFYNCTALTSLDLGNFDTSQVENMAYMFYNCADLTALNVSSFNTSKVIDMSNMFDSCSSLTVLDISNFDTSSVSYIWDFLNCDDLQKVTLGSLFSFYGSKSYLASMLPGSVWKSATTGKTYSNEEVATDRTNIADTYTKISAIAMHRLYNPYSGEHFYTSDYDEKEYLVAQGWQDEDYGWYAPETGDPVYRLYNKFAGEHHYTLDEEEKDALVKAGWKDEGIGWYSDTHQTVPVYRQYNPNAFANNHNYTADTGERATLLGLSWIDEGIGWYGINQ